MIRIGHGMDVHKLVEERKLILCGVEVPHHLGLLGHSDADVATHALMDAMLGALALGDIGKLFPDTDERYRGADSVELYKHVYSVVRERGYVLGNADVTIVAQKPKLRPYIDQMRQRLADAIGVDVERISVKATTTEKMGFEGEERGISAHAVCLLMKA
ncbi:MAG: 2-C-methyl-D-erythritol 2,4-cyclodiphosphate synthase [Clostridia bacterium]|nr:2-C-methyl-D-erythritol 2,4-cyclodiphosphate synthase [Clostridia bacterium]